MEALEDNQRQLEPHTLGRNVTSAGWQVTLCDPIWHVSSRSGVATLRTAIHLLLTYLLTLYRGQPMEVVQHLRDVAAIGGMVSIGPNDVNDTQTSGRFTEYIQLYFTIICTA